MNMRTHIANVRIVPEGLSGRAPLSTLALLDAVAAVKLLTVAETPAAAAPVAV
jgi:hypothetical protein